MLDKKGILQVPFELVRWIAAIIVVSLTFSFVWTTAQDQVAHQYCQTIGFNAGHADLGGAIICEGWLKLPLDMPTEK